MSVSYDSCKRPEEPRRYRRVPRCIARRRAWVVSSPRHVGAAPRRDKFGGLRDMSSTLAQGAAGVPNYLSGSSPGRLERRVLSEERGKCYSPRPFFGYSRATPRDASHYLNCRRCQPSQSTDPHQPAFALGSPVGVGIGSLAGEVESSCSHPREAMNLVHVCRISRRKPNCKQVPTCGIHALRT